ncbi:L-threonine ammonia-lyase [Polypterus senegalus]|uniref:L-threonine ammonia-lyase n=1 Tax=Polypterus senegalus TaxID=55291 RepID=UPI001962D098|nr:L-threonine ammonia-lyase [Polypterus senegalus]XP_039617027.1 L-threonine ammonia-lyase [Polypterus senegalus]
MNEAIENLTLEMIKDARKLIKESPLGVINTQLVPWTQTSLHMDISCNLYLKLENMQKTGSFKIRGVTNQLVKKTKGEKFVTMSAGNYGKSFAYALNHHGFQGKVLMPDTAPPTRSAIITKFGIEVERMPSRLLMSGVERCIAESNMTFLHSFDDLDLIAGYGSIGLEILDVIPSPDVILVCCGGGGLLSGVAAAIKLSNCSNTRVYGVEPEGACTMHKSFIEKRPVSLNAKSIAVGLAPPFAGTMTFAICQRYVEDILLVTDEEIMRAVSILYNAGLVVEPSGAAAFAALTENKVPDISGKTIVVILSGGNISKQELSTFPDYTAI